MSKLAPALISNYSHSFFKNGFTRNELEKNENGTPDVLSFETGFFGLDFDVSDLTKVKFAAFEDTSLSYLDCLNTRGRMTKELEEADLVMKVTLDGGRTYKATTCAAGISKAAKPFNNNVILWEAGKIAQNYELKGLQFVSVAEDKDTNLLDCVSTLTVVVWPDSFSLSLKLAPPDNTSWASATVDMQMKQWSAHQEFKPISNSKTVTLICDVNENRRAVKSDIAMKVKYNDKSVDTEYNDKYNAWKTTVTFGHGKAAKTRRNFPWGNPTDIRDYDEFSIKLNNTSDKDMYVPYLMHMKNPANVTGMVAMVCTAEGIPTGIPVQLSKDWHDSKLGPYALFYTLLPVAAKSDQEYMLRVVYGFYGELPSASHAQLSLEGYYKFSGRWEQMAIGCFGETFCMDPEMSCNIQNRITDVRGLFFREGANGKKWGWTACAWGGDWMKCYDHDGKNQLMVSGMKVAYVSHGPCLTDVRYVGYFGESKQVHFETRVRTLRTDDYARTFLAFSYKFNSDVTLGSDGYLHSMLSCGFATPSIAYGNGEGCSFSQTVSDDLKNGELYAKDKLLGGVAPHWVSYVDSYMIDHKIPDGTKHMIIRSMEANVGRQCFKNPSITFRNGNQRSGKVPTLDCFVGLPDGVKEFSAGDTITLDVEWITTAIVAENYYGPNAGFRDFLTQNPKSWKVPFREVQKNGSLLQVEVQGGSLQNKYPITIRVEEEVVTLFVTQGLGAVPMEFAGLPHTNYALYQIVDGEETALDQSSSKLNDFWQTDYDVNDGTYKMTFNPMLGDHSVTQWRLRVPAT
mmetsp:Transcript_9025/g.13095  ORF Transcript_9025/g.13095 Transcript_9025/m.13095 type:complete len:796 (-) Transcript_9025:326-2713(-)|eukprot:CAMPEP_0195515326 /NCGR_PEP_ID=MMETSP0794_2-20130614/6425_1 /TAXON_ID=515487 /ORGANISM="Stephanopyxis turris, Strain CCMP 815" /LENGTH=795 /DNA_ID=CAMNT_0040643729 /DNA_START=104 /DNA_END=2491 /DNA_ORIENTATION=-